MGCLFALNICSCFFKIIRVDFKPEEDILARKKFLVRSLKPKIGECIFDGTLLYSVNKLANEDQPTVFTAQNRVL